MVKTPKLNEVFQIKEWGIFGNKAKKQPASSGAHDEFSGWSSKDLRTLYYTKLKDFESKGGKMNDGSPEWQRIEQIKDRAFQDGSPTSDPSSTNPAIQTNSGPDANARASAKRTDNYWTTGDSDNTVKGGGDDGGRYGHQSSGFGQSQYESKTPRMTEMFNLKEWGIFGNKAKKQPAQTEPQKKDFSQYSEDQLWQMMNKSEEENGGQHTQDWQDIADAWAPLYRKSKAEKDNAEKKAAAAQSGRRSPFRDDDKFAKDGDHYGTGEEDTRSHAERFPDSVVNGGDGNMSNAF